MKQLNRKPAKRSVLPGYQISQQIYESANSVIYRAIYKQNQQPVILKVLKSTYLQSAQLIQYKQEYEIIRSLNTSQIIKVYNAKVYRGNRVLILEDFGGMSLDHWLEEWKSVGTTAFPLSQFFKLAGQIVAGLTQIQGAGIIHKNITPANIVFNSQSGELKIIDFGLATILSRETPLLKSLHALEGTLAYLSPEQTGRMNRTVDYRTDFYSLGVTFYELLTGRLPFDATDAMELVHYHLAKIPVVPHILNPAIPPTLSLIVLKLLAKAPEDRYQSLSGLKHDLDTCWKFWQADGRIPAFELGRQDRTDHFLIPETLYGRASEVETLLAAFRRVAHGATELMLVTGFSGIGKTAVVNEVHKPIVQQRGYFIKGKFDQFNHNIPFSAFLQAFRDLIGQLLSESKTRQQQWRSEILSALGENGQIIIDMIPELEQLIGPQPPAPELSGPAALNRANLVTQSIIQVFNTADHPIVIYLDDLQWADLSSLQVLQFLFSETRPGYLLLLGAYRDNEVPATHPLRLTLNELEKTGATVNTITLAPLTETDINQLIADSLNCSPELALPLTKLVYQITRGNPFFNHQLLKGLYEAGAITFQNEEGRWQYDLAQVRALALTDDVVQFMVVQLQKLPPRTQEILKIAACIGNKFDLQTLALIQQQSPVKTVADLEQAVQEGFVFPHSEVNRFFLTNGLEAGSDPFANINPQFSIYQFLHDRVQQAAYSLITPEQQQATHLKIGQLLLINSSITEQEERFFEIVSHLNLGRALITNPSERERLSQLNLMAGRKAKAAIAYSAAVEYLTTGIHLLPSDCWERHYDITLALHQELTEVTYLNTDFDQMEQWASPVLQHARTLLDTIKIYETKLMATKAQGQLLAALYLGLQVLQDLGVEFPDPATPLDIEQAFKITRQLWQERPPLSLLDLPIMDDPYRLAAMQIMTILISSAYIASPALLSLLVYKEVEFSIQYGNCPISIFSYANYGLLLCGVLGDIEAGYQFGQLALKLLERFQAIPGKSRAGLIVYQFISHWKEPLSQLLPLFREAYQSGLANGDLESASFNASTYCFYAYFAGQELAGLADEIEAYRQSIRSLKQESSLKYLEITQQTILNLLGVTNVPWELTGVVYNANQSLPLHQANRDQTALFRFYFSQSILLYLFGYYSQAAQQSALVEQYLDGVLAQFVVPMYSFYDPLIHLALYHKTTAEQQKEILKRVQEHQAKMQHWASLAPFNHQHRWELVAAEQFRVLKQRAEAIEHYDRAIAHARTNGYVQDEALANELAARFYLDWNKEKVAQAYLQEAYDGYNRWGAVAKVEQLEQHHAELLAPFLTSKKQRLSNDRFTSRGISTASTSLDLLTVIKASQTIAGEIELERLLKQMMRIALENAGAQRGSLLLEQDGNWVIEAQGDVDSPDIPVLQALDMRTNAVVPAQIVTHVARTHACLVLDDAANTEEFGHDPYIRQHGIKSVICTPLVNQGRLSGIIYLENNLIIKAFTEERLELLNLLSTQMALALDKARLYQQAQQEIAERKLMETALRESEYILRKSQAVARLGSYYFDAITKKWVSSSTLDEILGIDNAYPKDLNGWIRLVHPEQKDEILDYLSRHIVAEHNTFEKEYRIIRHNDGQERWIFGLGEFEFDESGHPLKMIGTLQDITERKQVEAQLQASLQEKEVLLKEIHHRVKNNLQIISSLLYLQSQKAQDEKLLELFRESRNRVVAMALIHEKLYQSTDLARINFADYVRDLARSLFTSYGIEPTRVSLVVETGDLALDLNQAVPCGLIINEIISNSLKYAFPSGRRGIVRVEFGQGPDNWNWLILSDDGVGMPLGFEQRSASSLGLKLIERLVSQIHGLVERQSSAQGTDYQINFPNQV